MKDRRIILTGASEGIGRALALALASRGARLALAARDRERLESLAQECRARGGEALAVPTDVTNQQDLEWLVAETVKSFGGLDAVIHNAGITMWSRFDALQDFTIFERIMRSRRQIGYYLTYANDTDARNARNLKRWTDEVAWRWYEVS